MEWTRVITPRVGVSGEFSGRRIETNGLVDEDSITLEEYVAMVKRLKNVGMDAWIEEMVMNGYTHFRILKMFNPKMAHIVEGFGGKNNCLPMVRRVLEAELKKRRKLEHVNTVDDVVELLKKSKNIIVLTGAGVRS